MKARLATSPSRFTSLPVRLLVALAFLSALLPSVALPATVVAGDFSSSEGRLIVIWRSDAPARISAAGIARTARSAYGRRSTVVALPGQADRVIAQLRTDPRIAAILPNSPVTAQEWPTSGAPNDHFYEARQADLRLIGMPVAWQTTTGSRSVVVAVLDTGMTLAHEDLDGVSVVAPWNEIANTTDVADGDGHGTHVIGTIAAETNNGLGVAGVAPGVSIMPIKVLDDRGSGEISDIMDGIDYARLNGATVINMSLGGPLGPGEIPYFQATIDAAYAAGITIVAAAGNAGTSVISYPGGLDHVLAVGATDNGDNHADFSQTNATVDLSAPGVETASAYPPNEYWLMSGTSQAAPHVAGVAALVRSARPGITVEQVDQALLSTAVDLGDPGRDDVFGYGRIDAAAALAYSLGAHPTPTPTPVATPGPTPDPNATPAPAPGAQVITFSLPANGPGGSTVALTGSASSGLPPTYASATPTICTAAGSTLSLLAAGTCSVTASQPGDGVSWAAATPVSASMTVAAASRSVARLVNRLNVVGLPLTRVKLTTPPKTVIVERLSTNWALKGTRVELWYRPAGATWRRLTTRVLDATGHASVTLTVSRPASYRWRFGGTSAYLAGWSNVVSLTVR